uniref:Protein kinase domain-containing protein n=2 Tax=Chenopodium quinoa TaxID=63459 RepID=A0A803MN11_CHEQI
MRVGGNKDIEGKIPENFGDLSNLTVLGLADSGISGSLPSNLGKLSKLQTLSIYTTSISGVIPADLGNCSELVNIYLYENSLSGSIPPEIGKLKKLEKLLLWQNSLVGSIPNEIGNCTSLRSIDVSLNSISGSIPLSIGGLSNLEELMLSNNNVTGSIPALLSNCSNLVQLQLDTNQMSGLIPPQLGSLSKLTVFFAWANQLEGSIPSSLASCSNLESLDLSHNSLTGSIPPGLFQIKNLTKLLLLSNEISGTLPPEIGNCTSLIRLRLGHNRIAGEIPREIGGLRMLNFLDFSSNHFFGVVPDEIGSCSELQMLDLSGNNLRGSLPSTLSSLSSLQVLDASSNGFTGEIPASFGRLVSLNKLVLNKNMITGLIPSSLGLCSSLQLLDLGSNKLYGEIPSELCNIESLGIALNLSKNMLSGPIPSQLSSLNKLSILDLSHNKLSGVLSPLVGLDNLVSLNISYNNFSGFLPDNKLFRQLPSESLEGNEELCSVGKDSCFSSHLNASETSGSKDDVKKARILKIAIAFLIILTIAMVIMGVIAMLRARKTVKDEQDSELGDSWPWHFTPFQKLNFSVDQVLKCLVDSNIIGKGCSGMVYRADMANGEVIAVKKLWPTASPASKGEDEKGGVRDSFSAEVKTLGSIRHKNIVRFLGCCWNRNTRLLMYDYMPNGSLGSLLHESSGNALEWGLRYRILLGGAQGLAYLHHDCTPPIFHRDIKANNILIGLEFEPYIADFGLAKLVDDGDFNRSSNTVAGSYGYIAPEYGFMMKITEKSDVYSYGVVMLEVLTGKQPVDPTIPGGMHVVDWVRQKRGGIEVLDPSLLSRPETEIEEMVQALGIALLCVNSSPDERPTMKDVAAMLKEIKDEKEEYAKVDMLLKGSPTTRNDQGNKSPRTSELRVGTSTSRLTNVENFYPESNNTSFSASSLLYSSSSPRLSNLS